MIATTTEPRYFELPKTATYERRRIGWFPGQGDHSDPRLGTVRVIQYRSKGNAEIDHYGVQEDFEDVAPTARAFLLLNDLPPAAEGERRPEIYRVIAGTRGVSCTCRAATGGQPVCKHRDSIRLLLSEGIL